MRVLVAMSGGVDSSVAALMLQEQGHDLVGVFLRNGVKGAQAGAKTCCSASDSHDAAMVCDRLGIPFYSVDYEQEFAAIMDHFAAEYRRGR
ncbi:MAG: tRNA 2-thiouridine(34) synthase MnmA, partial [Planctomycetota bacterium]|nr:tRNA 2-thiouridine(34) synthase MnmA [Planctomycetota bacterium]